MIRVPYYSGDIYNSVVIGHTSLKQWVDAQRDPKPHVEDILKQIRVATSKKDYDLKQKLKAKLFYITPSVFIDKGIKRQYANIKYFTGLAQLDFDKLKNIKAAKELRDYLFETYDPIITAYLSPSKIGVKAIIRIPRVQDVEEYKDYYAAIEEEMKEIDSSFDHAPFNAVLPLFISMDKDILYREKPGLWTAKKDRTVDYVHLNAQESEFGRGMDDWEKSLKTIAFFKDKINEIQNDDGHPRLRSACLVLGSRAGAGYIDIQQAFELAEYCIDTNGYLLKKRNTYFKTAMWAINEGYNHPQYY